MDSGQMADQVIQNGKDIAAIRESVKSAHNRINENDRITEGIHKLAANVEALATQVKMLTESVNKSITNLEAGQRLQGERIGRLEREPGDKWKEFVKQIIGLVAAAVIGGVITKFL